MNTPPGNVAAVFDISGSEREARMARPTLCRRIAENDMMFDINEPNASALCMARSTFANYKLCSHLIRVFD